MSESKAGHAQPWLARTAVHVRPKSWLHVLAALLPILLVLWMTLGDTRPYYVTEIDFEQDYYYNSRSAYFGLPTTYHHPGTPVHQLGRLLMSISGPGLESTQAFLNLGYIVVGLAASLSLLWFAFALLRSARPWVGLLALASVVGWPPFLYYLNFYGADSFMVAMGLPALILFWRLLEEPSKSTGGRLFALGLVVGACLSFKMTFVPLAAAIAVALVVLRWNAVVAAGLPARMVRRWVAVGIGAGVYAAGICLSFILLNITIFPRILTVWYRSLTRGDAKLPNGDLRVALATVADLFARSNLLFLAMTVLVLGLGLGMWFWFLVRGRRHGASQGDAREPGEYDFIAGGVFLVMLSAAFLYTALAASAVTPGAAAGIRLRNMSACALVLPFAILFVDRLSAKCAWSLFGGRLVKHAANTIAAGVCAWGVSTHLIDRGHFVEARLARIDQTTNALLRLKHGDGRVAFWTESHQDYAGPASFHFWGNFVYASHAFDETVLAAFPDFTLFHLRSVGSAYEKGNSSLRQPAAREGSRATSRFGAAGEAAWRIRRWLAGPPDAAYGRLDEVLTGQTIGIRASAVAFPVEEMDELEGMSRPQLAELLRNRLNLSHVRTENVGGVDWFIVTSDDATMLMGASRKAGDGHSAFATL